ncbi:hypothetical protein [Idiomarina xiamenensis]|uniref:Uncharacterized protein n=1 Tax=Idiomarina xiamenensis 10-D-4 TaxID=740709 RepID=K2KB72_9GAMM|nr:hypothetical protein [Idiomarina xiamenensis]EKE83822.1 hypothetical protein A10D4_06741 [Idiomarina xiamenensis 10-D-4]
MRQVNNRQHAGWLLLEAITAIAIVGLLLAQLTQWLSSQQQQARLQQWQQLTERLQQAQQLYYQRFHQFADDLGHLQQAQLWQPHWQWPWRSEWLFERHTQGLLMTTELPSRRLATWLAKMLQGSRQQRWLLPPLQAGADEQWLHRQPQPQRPYLNQMQTELNMAQHDIRDVAELDAKQLRGDYIEADSWRGERLQVDERLQIGATQIYSDGQRLTVSADELIVDGRVRLMHPDNALLTQRLTVSDELRSEQFTANQLYAHQLQSATLDSDTVRATDVQIEQADIDQLFSQQIIVDRAQVGYLQAQDIVSDFSSVNQNWQQLSQLQNLWQQCLANGGCQ